MNSIRRVFPFLAMLVCTWAILIFGAHKGGAEVDLSGKAAPSWTLKDPDGKTVSSDNFKGKVVILDFWATWCPPCRMEIPNFVELQEKYKEKGLVVVGISLDEGPSVVKTFMRENKINYPMVMGNSTVAEKYSSDDGIPTTFLIDRQGHVVAKHVGFTEKETFDKEIQKLL